MQIIRSIFLAGKNRKITGHIYMRWGHNNKKKFQNRMYVSHPNKATFLKTANCII